MNIICRSFILVALLSSFETGALGQVNGECQSLATSSVSSRGINPNLKINPNNLTRNEPSRLQTVPPTPALAAPLNDTVVDADTGLAITGPNRRSALTLQWTPRPGSSSLQVAVGSTTHYRICIYENGKSCDSATVGASRGLTLYEIPCGAPQYVANMSGFQVSNQYRVNSINWKIAACNRNRTATSQCSQWSSPRTLKWLPPPQLAGPRHGTTFENWRFDETILRAESVDGVSRYLFCIAKSGTTCREQDTTNMNTDPWVVSTQPASGRDPAVRLEPTHPGSGTVWFAGLQVNWTAASCLDLPTGGRGCVYQRNYRTVRFQPAP